MHLFHLPERVFKATLIVAAFALGACGGGSAPQLPAGATNTAAHNVKIASVPAGERNWQLQAGGARSGGALQALAMLPDSITIDAGDSITWTVSGEAHTITFNCCAGDPTVPQGGSTFDGTNFVSSGILGPGQTYTLTFTKPGTYHYGCVLHPPEMAGTIVVQPHGAAYPNQQGFYTGLGHEALNSYLHDADNAVKNLGSLGLSAMTLAAGLSPGGPSIATNHATVLRFLSGDRVQFTGIEVPVGTTITWINESGNEPHTVTFPIAGKPLPHLPGDPFTPPIGGPTYDGSAITNSGVLNPGQSYQLKFTKAGKFVYFCLFHDAFGMVGQVTVQ